MNHGGSRQICLVPVEFRILGPVAAVGPSGPVRLPGRTRTTLLGVLCLRVGENLTRQQLIQALWGTCPPVTAVKSLNSHVAVVRRGLERAGLDGVLATGNQGYALELPREVVDAQRFSDDVSRARAALRAGDTGQAVASLQDGLSLWRGDVMTGCAPAGWGAADAVRLRELRVLASQRLWQARLGRGEVGNAVVELERLVAVYPLQERFWELLMLALCQSGRRAEALLAFDRLGRVLKAELSVEPSPRLSRLRDRL